MGVKLGEKSIGQHGSNVYYKEFTATTGSEVKLYRLGKFYFVKKSKEYPVTVAEFQLIWRSLKDDKSYASVKLYFKPDNECDGETYEPYGKDEVVEAAKQVVIECSKFPSWECSPKLWHTAVGESLYIKIQNNKINSILEKASTSNKDEQNQVKILSFPQYCRYKTCLKMMHLGIPMSYQQLLARGGLDLKNLNMVILFSRKQFYRDDIEDFSLTEKITVPVFKGRPRKRKNIVGGPATKKKMKIMSSDNSRKQEKKKEPKENIVKINTISCKKVKKGHLTAGAVKSKRDIRGKDTITKNIIEDRTVHKEEYEIFSKDLHKFMEEKGMPIIKVPSIGCAQVEPLILYHAVKKYGGYGQVTLNRLWRNVYDCMGHSTMITNAATGTRKVYEKLLLPYEKHLRTKEKSNREKPIKETVLKKADSIEVLRAKEKTKDGCEKKPTKEPVSVRPDRELNSQSVSLMMSKQRGRPSKKFRNQIEKLRTKQTRRLEEATSNSRPIRSHGRKPPWVNELNVDIVNSRRKVDVQSMVGRRERDQEINPSDSEIISPRRIEIHAPSKAQSQRLYSSNRDSSKTNQTMSKVKSQQQRQHDDFCEFKIQSVRSLATPERRPAQKVSQYLHYPFSSSYEYVPAAARQYYTLNETNTLIPVSEQYNPNYPFRDAGFSMRTFRHDHSPENSSYKIKSSALKNHEPYIIHHPTHVNRAYQAEIPGQYPVIYTHHPRYVGKSSRTEVAPGSRHDTVPLQRTRYITSGEIKEYNSTNYPYDHTHAHATNTNCEKPVPPEPHQLGENFPSVCVISEPLGVLSKHKWSTSAVVSCNI